MKSKSGSVIGLKGKIIIGLEIVVLVALTVLTIFVIKGDISLKDNESTFNSTTRDYTENSIVYKEGLTFGTTQYYESTEKENDETHLIENDIDVNEESIATTIQNTSSNTHPAPTKWTTAEIISKAADAVNKTKAYKGNLTVNHSEGFTANVTECSAGGIVRSVVDLMIGWVVKPVEETLTYKNGTAVNSEGETVPIILPKRNGFSLNENGVKSATVQQQGNEYIIKIHLVQESVGMYDVPTHNAASVGYLDVASFDISFMEIDSADIVYKGSSIELRINAEGYVTYANYKIPLHIEGSAHKGSISGSATFEGEQTEEWRLAW